MVATLPRQGCEPLGDFPVWEQKPAGLNAVEAELEGSSLSPPLRGPALMWC